MRAYRCTDRVRVRALRATFGRAVDRPISIRYDQFIRSCLAKLDVSMFMDQSVRFPEPYESGWFAPGEYMLKLGIIDRMISSTATGLPITRGESLILGLLTWIGALAGRPVEDGSAMQRLGRGGG
jgi:hypothetical protein